MKRIILNLLAELVTAEFGGAMADKLTESARLDVVLTSFAG